MELLSCGCTMFADGLAFSLSLALLIFLSTAFVNAVMPTIFLLLGYDDPVNNDALTVAVVRAVIVLAHGIATASLVISSDGMSNFFLTSVEISTIGIATTILAISLTTLVCAKSKALMETCIHFVARNCMILKSAVYTPEEAKKCATFVVSLLVTNFFCMVAGGVNAWGMTSTESNRLSQEAMVQNIPKHVEDARRQVMEHQQLMARLFSEL